MTELSRAVDKYLDRIDPPPPQASQPHWIMERNEKAVALLLLSIPLSSPDSPWSQFPTLSAFTSHCITTTISQSQSQFKSKSKSAHKFTSEGPPPQQFPNQNVLDYPDALWLEDEWTAEEEAAADRTFTSQTNNSSNLTPMNDDQRKQWDMFYKRNQANFFKDRHYMLREFPSVEASFKTGREYCLLEVGCGVGNALLPLLTDSSEKTTLVGFELAKTAVDILKADPRFKAGQAKNRAFAYEFDITSNSPFPHKTPTSPPLTTSYADAAMLMFTLSAIEPSKHRAVLKSVIQLLKPGGSLLFRDYGWGDAAQYKLSENKGRVLERGFYVKQDGTRVYYFKLEEVKELLEELGMEVFELRNVRRQYCNRDEGERRRRCWVQGEFRKRGEKVEVNFLEKKTDVPAPNPKKKKGCVVQ